MFTWSQHLTLSQEHEHSIRTLVHVKQQLNNKFLYPKFKYNLIQKRNNTDYTQIPRRKSIRKYIECDRSTFPTEALLSCAKKVLASYLEEIIPPIDNNGFPHKTEVKHISNENKSPHL